MNSFVFWKAQCKIDMKSFEAHVNVVLGGECFYIQETGGVSRIFREVVPRLRQCVAIDGIDLYLSSPPPAPQSVDGLFDRFIGHWLQEDRRPFQIRKSINRTILNYMNRYILDKFNSDVYISTYYSCPPQNTIGIAFVYDMTFERFPECFEAHELQECFKKKKICFEKSTRLVCISEQTQADLISHYGVPASKCRVCYLGGSEFASGTRVEKKSQSNDVRIIYVGDWRTAYKNFDFLLKSLEIFSGCDDRECILHVVSRMRPTAKDWAFHCEVFKGTIHYHENADDAQLRDLYCQSDAFVYPSLWEGFGIPIVEALSCGLPVACSDIPVFHEVGGDAVEYFDPHNADACAAALERAIQTRNSTNAITRRIQRAKMFTWDKCADGFTEVIREAAGEL